MLRRLFKITTIILILFVSGALLSNINNQIFAQERISIEEAKKLGIPEDKLKGWYCSLDAGDFLAEAKTDTDYDKAIEKFKELMEIYPLFTASSYTGIGEAYMRKSFLHKEKERRALQAKAEEYWKKAIVLDSRYAEIIKKSREYYTTFPTVEEERREEAEKYYRKGRVTGGFAILEDDEEKYKEAIENLKKAIEIDPTYEEPYIELGMIYYTKGMYPEAEESYEKAIEINPNSVEAHFDLANYYCWTKQLERAKRKYQKVLELDPNHEKARENLREIKSKK